MQIVRENISDLFKPKSKEEIDLINKRLEQQTDEFMTKIFSDLHKDPNNPNVYRNIKGEYMFYLDIVHDDICVSYDRIWTYFNKNIIYDYNIVKMLIENWLKYNTVWPQMNITSRIPHDIK